MPEPGARVAESLKALLGDPALPDAVRRELAGEVAAVEALIDRLEGGELHVAVLGRVSVGKSALLNALLGSERFPVDVLSGTTTRPEVSSWTAVESQGAHLIDTPGLDEFGGEDRERLAREVAASCDVLLFVVDGDLTEPEFVALRQSLSLARPALLVLNKADRYSEGERESLLARLRERVAGLMPPEHVAAVSARPAERVRILVQPDGSEREQRFRPQPDVTSLRELLATLLSGEGKALAAVRAGLIGGALADRLAAAQLAARKAVSERLIRDYALGKGLAVALTPVPVADLAAAAGLDVAMVLHLARCHGLPLSRREAGSLLVAIGAELTLLMGSVWAVHFLASALKGLSGGASVLLTAATQGGLAYYATIVNGRVAERWLAAGKSWGAGGPKAVVAEIVAGADRDGLIAEARAAILARLREHP